LGRNRKNRYKSRFNNKLRYIITLKTIIKCNISITFKGWPKNNERKEFNKAIQTWIADNWIFTLPVEIYGFNVSINWQWILKPIREN
jgi:hypothetical protein